MSNIRRIAALIVSLSLVLLSACGETVDLEQESDRTRPLGRYVEEQWELPVDNVEGIIGPALLPDGRLGVIFFYGVDEDETYGMDLYSTTDGTDWREETPEWLQRLKEDDVVSINDFHFSDSGEGVVAYYGLDEEGNDGYQVGFIHADGSFELTQIGKLPKPETSSDTVYIMRDAMRAALTDDSEADGEEAEAEENPADQGREEQEAEPASEGEQAEEPEAFSAVAIEAAAVDGEEADEDDDAQAFYNSDFFYASHVALGPDGLVYTQTSSAIEVYDPATGDFIREYKEGYAGILAGEKLAQIIYAEDSEDPDITTDSVLILDVTNETSRQVVSAEMSSPSTYDEALSGTDDGSIYVTVATGIYRLAPGGSTWERMVDGDLTSLTLPSISILRTLVHGEDTQFLVSVYLDQRKPALYNYVYSSDTPTRPDKELIVYTLGENKTLQQAAGVFRNSTPDAVVNITPLLEEGASATVDDAIRALNTELLAGKGPDLLVLDGMPLDSYLEKGVLADLTDLVEPMISGGELLGNVVGAYEQNGRYYAVPTRFALPTIWGDEDAVEAAGSLGSLASFAEANPGKQLFANMQPDYLLRNLAPVYQDRWLKDDAIDTLALAEFLQDVKRLADTDGNTYPTDDERSYSRGLAGQEDMFNDVMSIAMNETELMINYLQGFYSIMQPNGALFTRMGMAETLMTSEERASIPDEMASKVFRQLGEDNGSSFVPQGIVGVNSAGSQQELAKEFVRTLLSLETQTADLEDGFPVHTQAIAEGIERETSIYMSYAQSDDSGIVRVVVMGWPSEYLFQTVADRFDRLEKPAAPDNTLMEMILDESDAFFSGSRSASETAEAVAQRAKLLLAE